MTDDNTDRIRELKQHIVEWGSEREHEIQQQREAHQGLSKTLSLSLRVAALGSIPSVVWILCWAVVTSASEPILNQVVQSFGALVIFGAILAGTARASGLAAHWWFRGSVVHERLAAVVIGLLAAAILFGWVVVLIRW